MRFAVILWASASLWAADAWLTRFEPLLTPAEKKRYLSLSELEKPAFQSSFWTGKKITAQECARRVDYIDSFYGSGKPGSGANTDRGRVYLTLGAPGRITRLASTRSFFPAEIWYYPEAPAIGIHTELSLLFFQRNGQGEYRLYSPTVNTIRDLLNPQSGSRGMFPVNDIINESDIRTRLTLSTAEEEMIDAAVAVSRGVKGIGNEEILALAASPARALNVGDRTLVRSRFVTDRPPLETFITRSADGAPQVDLQWTLKVRTLVALEVQQGTATLTRNETRLPFEAETTVAYQHRLDLYPGTYTLMLTADDRVYAYPLTVPASSTALLIGNPSSEQRRQSPFTFDNVRLEPTLQGSMAILQLPAPSTVVWRLRQNLQVVWTERAMASGYATLSLTNLHLPPGAYALDAIVEGNTFSANVQIGAPSSTQATHVISYNANLTPAARRRFLAHQQLLARRPAEARRLLTLAMQEQPDDATRIELARAEALAGKYDAARDLLEAVLQNAPANFDALTSLAYVETQLQDYVVAEKLYLRALAIEKTPAVEKALDAVRAAAKPPASKPAAAGTSK